MSSGGAALIGILLAAFLFQVEAQGPTLGLFVAGGNEATFFVYFGAEEEFMLNFVTNSDGASLLTGTVDNITVTINGGSATPGVERIEVDAPPGTALISQTIDNVYVFRLDAGGNNSATTENYRSLLLSLQYISLLPDSSRSDPPRSIVVVASGPTGDSNPATANLILVVSNEAPPVIESRITVFVSEGAANGDTFGQLNATDPDGLDVTFSFQPSSDIVAVTPNGILSVVDTDSIDYETPTERRFELTIVATDTDPISPRSSQATLIINVNNVNDNAPQFTAASYTFNVNEEAPNVEAGTLMVTDDDQEPNTNIEGTVFFFILDVRDEILQNFEINRGTGIITVGSDGLDFETTESYTFIVQATDGTFDDTATVEIQVIDIPDNRPVIIPADKTILINLDISQREVFLTEGSGGQLRVSDSDSQFLQDGIAQLTVVRGATVSIG